jgi:opacity protein-like surface antigen
MPLTFADMNVAAGIGVLQVIDLDHFYQNNNSMSPYLGQQRPDPQLITNRNDTIHVQWYQYARTREGSVYGITPAVSVTLLPGLRIGGSATVLTGSSDDNERRVDRGHINIAIVNAVGQNFMVDTVYYGQVRTGTSSYTGNIFTLGLHFQQERYAVGLTIKPAMKLTRSWERDVAIVDTTRKSYPVRIDSTRSYHESGKDYLKFPFSYALGLVLTPTDKWTIAFDYEMRYLGDFDLTSTSNGTPTHPWTSSPTMRIGAEYRIDNMLSLRGGYRDDVQAFSPDGSAIIGEPARGGIYSIGAGLNLGNIAIDFAYEVSRLKYEDAYQSNVNYNSRISHQFIAEFAYRFTEPIF